MNTSESTPSAINWTGYIAITFLILLPLSVLTVRSGAWQQGLLLYALACFGSILLLILFVLFLMLPRFKEHRKAIRGRALLTVPGTLALLSLTLGGGEHPRIHDITTDTQDPPQFVTAETQRGNDANTLAIKPDVIEQQKLAYTDLAPIESSLPVAAAFERALSTAKQLGWEIYHQDAAAGIVEAVEVTRIMLFRDDVVIRVRPSSSGSIVDLRSVSRVGEGDLGANAKRIRAFVEAFKAS